LRSRGATPASYSACSRRERAGLGATQRGVGTSGPDGLAAHTRPSWPSAMRVPLLSTRRTMGGSAWRVQSPRRWSDARRCSTRSARRRQHHPGRCSGRWVDTDCSSIAHARGDLKLTHYPFPRKSTLLTSKGTRRCEPTDASAWATDTLESTDGTGASRPPLCQRVPPSMIEAHVWKFQSRGRSAPHTG
jgi:hypothetical protein